MSSTIIFFLFIPLLSLILLAINIIFAPHNPYIEKNNPFECGYTSFVGQNRIQFSISFFIFALLFLLFDLEILLVYPYLVSAYINETYGFLVLMTFLVILTIGFVFELGKKALTIDSRQTTTSNYSSMKKSLVIPHTGAYIGSTLINKNLKIIDYKYANFNAKLNRSILCILGKINNIYLFSAYRTKYNNIQKDFEITTVIIGFPLLNI